MGLDPWTSENCEQTTANTFSLLSLKEYKPMGNVPDILTLVQKRIVCPTSQTVPWMEFQNRMSGVFADLMRPPRRADYLSKLLPMPL